MGKLLENLKWGNFKLSQEKGFWPIELLAPQEKANVQALARVDHSIVALVGQGVPLTG